jgi:arylsulfatase A-like enzyme
MPFFLNRFWRLLTFVALIAPAHAEHPNVILVITDDQGYGDFGVTGNPVIETPNLDALAAQSVWMKTFYVSPVCSPTRASLLTGRYNYRTRCIDTYVGRSMMDPAEMTLAEVLRDAGYATGIFGKWHLGDSYPMRPQDQGFQESLVHRGGGLAQPADPPGNDRRYTNPLLIHNGAIEQTSGYCTDVYFRNAMAWIEQSHAAGKPFFAYIATNAPHDPYHDVPEDLRADYATKDLAQLVAVPTGQPVKHGRNDTLERIAAMITNIDDNVGQLLAKLDTLGIAGNTLVVFMTDNGPQSPRFVGPFRGMKSEVFEGGVRAPLWMRWPGQLKPGLVREETVAHIDLMPTILEVCKIPVPADLRMDGRSFWALATGAGDAWPERPIVIQSHRGDVPTRLHHFMIREGNWKLLHPSGFGRESFTGDPRFELYDVVTDPRESTNLAASQPEIVARLLADYNAWFDDVSSTRPDNYAPPRIRIGTPHESPTTLTRQDWRGGTWDTDAIGHWLVGIEEGTYDITVRMSPKPEPGVVEFRLGDVTAQMTIAAGAETCLVSDVKLPKTEGTLHATIHHGAQERGVHQLEVLKK